MSDKTLKVELALLRSNVLTLLDYYQKEVEAQAAAETGKPADQRKYDEAKLATGYTIMLLAARLDHPTAEAAQLARLVQSQVTNHARKDGAL